MALSKATINVRRGREIIRETGVDHQSGWSLGQQDTVLAALDRAVAARGDKVFLDFEGETYTFRELDTLSTRMGHELKALGVQPGQTVVLMLDNNVDAIVCWLAANKLRAIAVPINTALKGEFLRHQIADAGAPVVVCEQDYLERIDSVADHLPEMQIILRRGAAPLPAGLTANAALLDAHRGEVETALEPKPNPGDVSALIYTGGTTGPSKGCMVSYNYMCNLARLQLIAHPATEDDITLTPLPLFHMNALAVGVISNLLVGARVAFVPRFSVSGFWPEVERSGATIVSILGSMGHFLAQAPDCDAARRCFGQIHTARGNPYTEETKAIWRRRFGVKHIGGNGYGLTEAAVVTVLPQAQTPAPGSSGKRHSDFDVRIVDDFDRELPPGQAGEIIVRPLKPHVMFEGYWRRPEDTLKLMRNLWFHTGDIGKFDEDGFFYFVDRKKDYLRRRGENISSFEVESTFETHADIAEIAVHAVFSKEGEDDLKVTLVKAEDSTLSEAELFHWAVDRLPYYALPRYIEFRSTLPRNPQGRVLKYELRDQGCTPETWDFETSGITVKKR